MTHLRTSPVRPGAFATAGVVLATLAGGTSALAAGSPATAPKVTVRVEGATRTLLAPTPVTAPVSGSITKGGAPADACPADTAAGALNAATRGRWNGTYSKYGIEVSTILGTALHYARGSYWAFYVDGRYASTGICATKLRPGESLLFAAVPAKGKTPAPLFIRVPSRVRVGRSITLHAYVRSARAAHTLPVADARIVATEDGRPAPLALTTAGRGAWNVFLRKPGRVTLLATAKGDVRSAATTITVTR